DPPRRPRPPTCRCLRISRSCSWPASTCRRHCWPGSRTWPSCWDNAMPALSELIQGERISSHRPWPRLAVNEDGWRFVTSQLAAGYWILLALWGDARAVHMAVLDEATREIAVVTIACPSGRYPSVGALHAPAIRLERAVRDLWGLEPVGLPDTRPWLDLGFWE